MKWHQTEVTVKLVVVHQFNDNMDAERLIDNLLDCTAVSDVRIIETKALEPIDDICW